MGYLSPPQPSSGGCRRGPGFLRNASTSAGGEEAGGARDGAGRFPAASAEREQTPSSRLFFSPAPRGGAAAAPAARAPAGARAGGPGWSGRAADDVAGSSIPISGGAPGGEKKGREGGFVGEGDFANRNNDEAPEAAAKRRQGAGAAPRGKGAAGPGGGGVVSGGARQQLSPAVVGYQRNLQRLSESLSKDGAEDGEGRSRNGRGRQDHPRPPGGSNNAPGGGLSIRVLTGAGSGALRPDGPQLTYVDSDRALIHKDSFVSSDVDGAGRALVNGALRESGSSAFLLHMNSMLREGGALSAASSFVTLSYFERGDQRIQKLRAKWVPNGMVLSPQILSKILL